MKRYSWWQGAAFYGGVLLAGAALRRAVRPLAPRNLDGSGTGGAKDRAFYERTRLPVFAPPGFVFPMAWSVNSFCSIAGALHVANLPPGTPGRTEYLRMQTLAWLLFATFNAAYFGLRSPINAAAVTSLYTLATLASLRTAREKFADPTPAWSLAPTVAWLVLANPVGWAQAAWNPDPFWKTGLLWEPPESFVKARPS